MKKLQNYIWLMLVLSTLYIQANNGKVTFVYPVDNINIDGSFEDWNNIKMIPLLDGLPDGIATKDFQAIFQIGYNEIESAIYFIVEVTDNSYVFDESKPWYRKDNLVLYINPQHSERAATASMLILNEDGIQLEQPDVSHQFLEKSSIIWKLKRRGNKRYYEGKILLKEGIQAYRSVGFDVMVCDIDKNETSKYVTWGKGGEKQYRSGQLGDAVFLKEIDKTYGELKGEVIWEEDIKDPLPDVVKIKSIKHPELWITIEVDSTGNFSTKLPIGDYAIQSAYKIASPEADNGDNNQSRIDDTYRKKFSIKSTSTTDIETFKIPTYKLPHYIYENEGVLHNFDSSDIHKVDNFIATICDYYNIPGASVGLIKDGKVVYHNQFGVENLLTQNPVTEDILFQAASVTKSVFAFIVLRLVEQGIFDLDKPLYEYLDFPNIAHNKNYKLLTARMVMSHQSGLPNWGWGGPQGHLSGQKTDLLFTPGTEYEYSGEAFEYLGRVIEKVSGKVLEELLKEEVIDVLDMPEIYFKDNGKVMQTRGHYADGKPTYYGLPYRAGVAYSILAEAKAFSYFVAGLSNKKGLSEAMYDEIGKRLAFTNKFDSPDNLYWNVGTSLGFFVQDTPYGKAILHGGNNGNFQAEFILFTEKKMGFVVFTNSNTGHKLAQELGKYLIHGKN